jgi:hypothetical protein
MHVVRVSRLRPWIIVTRDARRHVQRWTRQPRTGDDASDRA